MPNHHHALQLPAQLELSLRAPRTLTTAALLTQCAVRAPRRAQTNARSALMNQGRAPVLSAAQPHASARRLRGSALALALALSNALTWGGLSSAAAAATPSTAYFPVPHQSFDLGAHGLSYEASGARATITANGARANYKLLWQDFKLAAGHTLNYASAPTELKEISFLNIVKGGPRSLIAGTIESGLPHEMGTHGPKLNFYLINPNGISLHDGGEIRGFNEVYLGTEQVSSELLQRFESSNEAVSLAALTAAGSSELNLGEGMGKVRLVGTISSDNLIVNGSQIIIGDVTDLLYDNDAKQVYLPQQLKLVSSTNRIDIGGALDTATGQGSTYRAYLATQGLTAAAAADTVKARLNSGEFIDHSDSQTIGSVEDLNAVDWSEPELKLWLTDNLSLDEEQYAALHTKMEAEGFSGQVDFDGAFNAISYEGVVEQGGCYGLFTELNGAHIANLKLYGASLELDRDYAAYDQPLKVGALAGAMSNSTLHNVEVSDFNFTFPRRWSGADQLSAVMVGGLAGSIAGTTALSNVTAGLGLDTLDALEGSGRTWLTGATDAFNPDGLNHNALYYGHLAGTVRGSLEQHGVVAALAPKDWPLGAAWGHADDDAHWQIATSFKEAVDLAELRGEGAQVAAYYAQSGSGDELELQLKGFLKPFFIHDYNFMYAGPDVTHNYGELTDAVNAGFDLGDYFTLSGTQLDGDYAHAGCYEYDLSNRTADELGENFYFTYAHAGNTWDESAGGSESSVARSKRPDGLLGSGTLNINQKPITVDLGDQTITEGEEGAINLTPGEDTIDNYGEWARLKVTAAITT